MVSTNVLLRHLFTNSHVDKEVNTLKIQRAKREASRKPSKGKRKSNGSGKGTSVAKEKGSRKGGQERKIKEVEPEPELDVDEGDVEQDDEESQPESEEDAGHGAQKAESEEESSSGDDDDDAARYETWNKENNLGPPPANQSKLHLHSRVFTDFNLCSQQLALSWAIHRMST